MRYIIQDWTGRVLLNGKTFKTFDDAWSYILCELTDRLGLTEEDYSEYFVVEEDVRETRYLEANDIRKGLVNRK